MKKRRALIGMLSMWLMITFGGSSWADNYTSGSNAGVSLNMGDWDAFVGDYAGEFTTDGSFNTSAGECTGNDVDTGDNNVFAGYAAGGCMPNGLPNTFTEENVAVGYQAGMSLTWAANVFVGAKAGASSTGGADNTFIGYAAGSGKIGGGYNTYIGNYAGALNQSGSSNIFIGDHAGYYETGSNRLYIAPTGTAAPLIYGEFDNNKLVVNGSLTVTGKIITGSAGNGITYLGAGAGPDSYGDNNTFVGSNAGHSNVMGNTNTFVGQAAGYSNYQGTGNVYIGNAAGYFETSSNNRLYISDGFLSNLIYGEFDNKVVKINGELILASDERLKENIEPLRISSEDVLRLRGVSYEWKGMEQAERGFGGNKEIGLIAQEVEAVLPGLVYTDAAGLKSVAYDKVVPVLIEAIKDQQREIKAQRDRIREKDEEAGKIEDEILALEKRISTLPLPLKTADLK